MPIRDLGGSGFGGSGSAGFKLGAPQNVFDAGVGDKASAVLLRDAYATSNPSWLAQYQTDFDDKSPSSVLLLYTEAGVPVATYTQYNGSTQGWRDLSTAKGLRGLKGDSGESVTSADIQGNDVVFVKSDGSFVVVENLAKPTEFSEIQGNPYDNSELTQALNDKQSMLVSGINIKTINNVNLLGSGNIEISGGGGEGTTDHNSLTNRNLPDQHEIEAITGLRGELDQKVNVIAGKGLSDENYTLTEKTKLANIEPEATKNQTDSVLIDRANHVGTQPISSVTNLQSSLDNKVDAVAGKVLSDQNYTLTEKVKLSNIEAEATKNQLDSFLLDRANHVGAMAISDVDNLQSSLDNKVSTTDPRLSDAREWIAGEVSLEEAQARTSGTFKKWSALRVGQAVIAWWQETGNQAIIDDLISSEDLSTALSGKVDKVAGFGLSEANFTQAEKDKLAALEDSKFKGLFETVEALETAYPTADAGSYAFIDGTAGNPNQLYVWATDQWEIVGGEVVSLTPAQVKQLLLENADTHNFGDAEKQKLEYAVTQTELANALTSYAQLVHNHSISQITGLQSELDGKAASEHTHGMNQIVGLETALNGKASSDHDHTIDDVVGLQTALDGKAASVHNHSISQINGLVDSLDDKVAKEDGKGLSSNDYTTVEKNKLGAIASNATANATDAQLRDRSTHTGSQAISTVTNLQSTLDSKVTNVSGKGLSTNDYDNVAKGKVDSLGTAASRDATESSTDTTGGRLLKVGDFGVGATANINLQDNINTTVNIPNGSYRKTNPTAAEHPTGLTSDFQFISAVRSNTTDSHQMAFVPFSGSLTNMFFRRNSGGNLTPWHKVYHTGNTGTAVTYNVTESEMDTTTGRLLKVGDHGFGRAIRLTTGLDPATPDGLDFHNLDYGDYSGFVSSAINGPAGAAFFGTVSVRKRFDIEDRKVINASLINGIGTSRSWVKFQTVDGWSPWYLQYDQSSAVRAVSQEGGVQTGGLMQYGETPNGKFWRYANGQQITQSEVTIDFSDYLSQLESGVYAMQMPAVIGFLANSNTSGFISMVHSNYSLNANKFLSNTHLNVHPSNGQAHIYRINNSDMSNEAVQRTFVVTLIGRFF